MNYILITGCLGFIGSSFTNFFLKKNKNNKILGIDKITYAADYKKINIFEKNKNFKFLKIDISDYKNLKKVFKNYNIVHVINIAAETHVDNSIKDPDIFINSNIVGTYNLLKLSQNKWQSDNYKKYKNSKFLQISTDEVYGSINRGKFTENSPFKPNSPYSSSKASADLLVRSFNKTYKLKTLITNSANNFGPGQHKEKLIPKIVNNLINKKYIPIYGNGLNVRNWLYVEENCEALFQVFKKGKIGENYNIGSDIEFTNYDLAKKICNLFGKIKKDKFDYKKLIKFVKDRPGHDLRYSLDIKKVKKDCKWKPSNNFDNHLKKTILEIINNK